ncbi:MAG: alpha/beta fold hydrolase [Phycisphaerae bacterium]
MGSAIDVGASFDRPPNRQHSLLWNLSGIQDSAQASGVGTAIDAPAPSWVGFEDVWIPVAPGLEISARLGVATDRDTPRTADCVVILPGLLGDNSVLRTRDVAAALHHAGLHVLAVELRGHGQTEARYPNFAYNFGVLETGDLLAVDQWLRAKPFVRRTGLIGFCWSANLALLTAWEDGRADDDPIITPRLRPFLRPRDGARHYEAGVIAFSPVLKFEEIVEQVETDRSMLLDPVLDSLQDTVVQRMRRRAYPRPDGNLRRLIELEFARSPLSYDDAVADGFQYLRLTDHRGKPAGDKLRRVRCPTLIVHAANDPLAAPQAVADLIASLPNRNVAALMLPGGGHVGFAPYARSFFYGLILAYFDPVTGAGRIANSEALAPD